MYTRKILFLLTGLLAALGVGVAAYMFAKLLEPNIRQDSNRPVFSSDAVPIGEMIEFRDTLQANSIFVARSDVSRFVVFSAYWHDNYNFFSVGGSNMGCIQLSFVNEKIICNGRSEDIWMQWDLDGKSSGGVDFDLELINYEMVLGDVHLN